MPRFAANLTMLFNEYPFLERFGAAARFRTSMGAGLDLDELMVYLEARDKIRVTGDMVFPGGRPARAQ